MSSDFGASLDLSKMVRKPAREAPANAAKHKRTPKKAKEAAMQQPSSRRAWRDALFLSIALLIAVTVRLHYANMPITDLWAEQSARAALLPAIEHNIGYSLDTEARDRQIEQELTEALSANRDAIEKKSGQLKESFRDPDGETYLYGIDPYKFYKDARDRNFDSLLPLTIHAVYRTMNALGMETGHMKAAFYIPVLFVCLTIFPLYFLARRLVPDWAAGIAASAFAAHPEYLKFSFAGLTDTNTLNTFFLVLMLWLACELILAKNIKTGLAAGAGLIAALFLFRFTWSGYYIASVLVLGVAAAHFSLQLMKGMRNRSIVMIASLAAIVLLGIIGINLAASLLPQKLRLYLGQEAEGIWPYDYKTILELIPLSPTELLGGIGGPGLMLIAALGAGYLLYRIAAKERLPGAIAAIGCTAAFFLLSLQAVRMFPYSVPFLCVLLAAGLYMLYRLAERLAGAMNWESGAMARIAGIVVLLLLLVLPALSAAPYLRHNYETAGLIRHKMDDSLYNAAIALKDASAPGAVVFAWWDKGHLVHAISDREVLLSARPAMPRTYWMAVALAANDEKYSLGIMRMLACNGENRAFTYIARKHGNWQAMQILQSILPMAKADAAEWLQHSLGDTAALAYTHCEPPELFVVLTDDRYSRFPALLNYADWDIRMSDVMPLSVLPRQEAVRAIQDMHNATESEAFYLYEKATRDSAYTGLKQLDCSRADETFQCMVGSQRIVFNGTSVNFNPKPKEVIVAEDRIARHAIDPAGNMTLIFYNRAGRYHALLIDESIANSMYIRLMVLGGEGLDHFSQIADEARPETQRAVAYKVIWQG